MKFTWGTGIAITLIAFVLTMSFAVYKVMTQDFDLVTSDYYEQELVYQDKIDQKENALALGEPAKMKLTEGGLVLSLPAVLKGKYGHLELQMYCVNNEDLDFMLTKERWQVEDLTLKHQNIGSGKWIAKLTFKGEEKTFYFEPEIHLP